MANIIRRGVRQNVMRPDIPAEVLAGALLAMLQAHDRNLTQMPLESRSLQTIVDLFLRGAGGNGPQTRSTRRAVLAAIADDGDRT